MNYILTIVQNGGVCTAYGYDKKDDALATFHNELGYRVDRTSTVCHLMDASGNTVAKGAWFKEEE